MAVILKEIKIHATEGKCRVLVVADKANVFYETGKVKYMDKSVVEIDNITIARAFKKLFLNDWVNIKGSHISECVLIVSIEEKWRGCGLGVQEADRAVQNLEVAGPTATSQGERQTSRQLGALHSQAFE